MEKNKKAKISFFKTLWESITGIENYKEYATQNLGTVVKYLLKLVLAFTFIMAIIVCIKGHVLLQEGLEFFEENIPELTYKDSVLEIDQEEVIQIGEGDFPGIIIIDTISSDQELIEGYKDKIKTFENGILVLNDEIVVKLAPTTILNTYQYIDLTQNYNLTEFNKQDILNYLRFNSNTSLYQVYLIFFVVTFIYLYLVYLSTITLDAILLGVLTFLIARLSRIKIKYSSSFGLAVHALTLPIVLNLIYIGINTFTGFEIKYFSWMYTIISYIYIVAAIMIIRNDLIKQQIELTKIISEQEKVRLELEEKQRHQKKKKSKDKKRSKKRKKKKRKRKRKNKDKKKKKIFGGEPEGSNA